MPKSYSAAPETDDHEIVTRLPVTKSPGDEEEPGDALRGTLGREMVDVDGEEDRGLVCVFDLVSDAVRRSFMRQRDRSRPVSFSHASVERADTGRLSLEVIKTPMASRNGK